jgi:drug/metabolite transporter (DMT)-like permease
MRVPPPLASLPAPVQAGLYMLVAMACFATMAVCIRMASHEVHALEIVFFRNFLALAFMLPWLCRQGLGVMRTQRIGLYTARSLINVVGMAAGFTGITLIPLAEATALSFTSPLFTTIAAVVVLGEVVRARRITALAVGFIGTLIVLRPGFQEISLGASLTLTNAVLIAVTTMIVKQLTRTERPEAIVLYMALFQTPLSLVPALFVWEWPTLETFAWMAMLAGAGTLGHVCWTRACGMAEITQLQPIEFVRLPLVGLAGFLLFAEAPSVWTWVGGAVIFCSTAYITHREAQLARRARAAVPPGAPAG